NEWTSKRNVNEIISHLLKYDIPCGPVNTIADACEDPHIAKAREMVISINQPKVGEIKIINCPIKIFPFSPKVRGPAPLLGQHTNEVLKELVNLNEEQLNELRREGVIY
ncbi:MAG: CoA transferase, partial [Nitrososphaeria archaeon]